jgi:molecular chaperone IbpA
MVVETMLGLLDDPFFNRFNQTVRTTQNNYPPYNVIKVGEDLFILEFALAGFDKEEISITVENNQLKVSGQRSEVEEDESVIFLHKGIAARKFSTVFNLPEYMEVESAQFSNGILELTLEKHIPEEKKPKTITIN